MKKALFLIVFAAAMVLVGTSQVYSQKLVIIRTVEVSQAIKGPVPLMHITEDDGSCRVIELEYFQKQYLTEESSNHKKIHFELKKYLSEGYRIESHTKAFEGYVVFEDYILVKD